jgi:hypothetical protein
VKDSSSTVKNIIFIVNLMNSLQNRLEITTENLILRSEEKNGKG